MPIRRIDVPPDILEDANKLGCSESAEETLAYWLKRGHDTDENVHRAYEAYDVLVASKEVQESVIRMPRRGQKKAA